MTDKACVLIWGASGQALVIRDILHLMGKYEVTGFIDDRPEQMGREVSGDIVLGNRAELKRLYSSGVCRLIIGIGDCTARLRLAKFAREQGFEFVTAIHPHSIVAADISIGAGTVVAAGAVINPGAQIGEQVIINTSATVDHECVIEDGAHVGPGVHLGGCVRIGRGAWIGIGAIVKDRVKIGVGTVIGAGAVVLEDIPEKVVAYGVPAKVQRKVTCDD